MDIVADKVAEGHDVECFDDTSSFQSFKTQIIQTKKAFLRNLAHDINIPLENIVGNALLLKKCLNSPSKVVKCSQNIEQAALALMRFHRQMEKAVLHEYTKDRVSLNYFSLSLLVEEIIYDVNMLIADKAKKRNSAPIVISCNIDKRLPKQLYGDSTKVMEIVRHLLFNAVKYTTEGSVNFTIESIEDRSNLLNIRFIIKDTGIGIEPKDREKIYQYGQRLVNSYNSGISGLGVGLYIVKNHLDQLGGQINFTSVPGEGSTFYVEIPFQEPTV